MTDGSFGIGVVGAGFISREAHLPSVDYLPNAHVAAIQNRTRETSAELAAECREAGRGVQWSKQSILRAERRVRGPFARCRGRATT